MTGTSPLRIRDLVGERKKGSHDPVDVIAQARRAHAELRTAAPAGGLSLRALKERYGANCRVYYTAAAVSRRKHLAPALRRELEQMLFGLRKSLERAIPA